MTLSLQEILPILVGFLQLVVVAILLFSYRTNKHVNIYLIIILISAAIRFLHAGFTDYESDNFTDLNFSWFRLLLLVTIPSTYLYLKSLISDTNHINPKDGIHLIYPILWSVVVILQSIFSYFPAEVFIVIRKVNILLMIGFYITITIRLVMHFYSNRNRNLITLKHFESTKNWVILFFVLMILVNLRGLFDFCFDLDQQLGLLAEVSSTLQLFFILIILFIALTSPEFLYGYPKLKKAITNDSEYSLVSENKIVKLENQFYINDKLIDNYFEGKTLVCLYVILNNGNEFIALNSLDDHFTSDFRASLPTVKKRREHSIKEIKFTLSFKLDVPVESVFIESRDEIDKRIKLIKINPDLLLYT